jgi:VWFA-related protein
MRRLFALFCWSTLLAASAIAQQQPLTEMIEVRVVNIDVSVRDKAGNPVRGLKAEDFELLEDGVAQPITNFHEVSGEPAAPSPGDEAAAIPTRRNRIAVFVDQSSVDVGERQRVLEALKGLLAKSLRPGDEVMVTTWLGRMQTVLPFTSDQKAINDAIDGVAKSGGQGRTWSLERNRIISTYRTEVEHAAQPGSRTRGIAEIHLAARSDADVYAESLRRAVRAMIADLGELTKQFGAVEGKKAIIFVGQSVSQLPGIDLYEAMDDLFEPHMQRHRLLPMKATALAQSETLHHEEVAKAANAAGVTYYMIHSGDLRGLDEKHVESTRMPTGTGNEFAKAVAEISSFHLISTQTGGVAVAGRRDYSRAMEQIRTDLLNYYSIGYRPSDSSSGKEHNIRVRVKNADHVVRTRSSYRSKSLQQDLQEMVVANVLHPRDERGVKVEVTNGPPVEQQPGVSKVPFRITVPFDDLTFLPDGADLVGGFDLYIVVGDPDGNLSNPSRQNKPLKFPAARKKELAGLPLTFNLDILMRKGTNILSVAVADTVGGTLGFTRKEIVVP